MALLGHAKQAAVNLYRVCIYVCAWCDAQALHLVHGLQHPWMATPQPSGGRQYTWRRFLQSQWRVLALSPQP